MSRKTCEYYHHPKTCTHKGFCAEQLLTDTTHCCSNLYYSIGLEQKCLTLINENNRLKEENNTLELLLEGKNNQYDWAKQKYEELENEKAKIKKYLGISSKTIMQRLEELQEYKDEIKVREDHCKQALDEIEKYFDKRCDVCREQFEIEASCAVCWKKDIKDIINKAKE